MSDSTAALYATAARYGVAYSGDLVGTEYHEQVEGNRDWTLAEVSEAGGRVTRIRLLGERGRYDVSYVHATLPGDRIVRVNLSHLPQWNMIPKHKIKATMIEWAKAERVFAKGLGMLDEGTYAIMH